MISKYNQFITESKIFNLILESKIEFSKNFLSILSQIDHPIAKDLISLQSQDHNVNYNYIDVDLKSNDTLTFIQDARAQKMTQNIESIFKVINSTNHLKTTDFKTDLGKEQNTEIYRLLGLNIEDVKKAPNETKVKITGKVVSPFDSSKVYVSYKGVEGDYSAVININGVTEDSEEFQKLWTTNRNPVKIGRFINAILLLTGKKYADHEKENFVSKWKSVVGEMNNAFNRFDIVQGYDIYEYYQSENYLDPDNDSTLAQSCMKSASEDMLAIYTENPEVCKMVIKYSDDGVIVDGKYKSDKIVGRALLWTTTSGDVFLDRIYTMDSSDEELFKRFAHSNGWWCRKSQSSSQNFVAEKGSETKRPIYVIQLKRFNFEAYPYLDTFCYLNSHNGKISNSPHEIGANYLLNDTDGGADPLSEDGYDD
jgi:hypothetical protein